MPFWKCYYHVVWATKHRQPLIEPVHETVLFAAIERKTMQLRCELLAVNGVADHIHTAVMIPPSMNVSKRVGDVKGFATHELNHAFELESPFHWQTGYGVLSFGERNLSVVKAYIANQKIRHQNGDLNAHLERTDD